MRVALLGVGGGCSKFMADSNIDLWYADGMVRSTGSSAGWVGSLPLPCGLGILLPVLRVLMHRPVARWFRSSQRLVECIDSY